MTFSEILHRFKRKYPRYARKIDDYRPSRHMDGITIWFKGGLSLSLKYNENTDQFTLLDLDNYTF